MLASPIPSDEAARLAELDRLDVMYSKPEAAFDRVTAELAKVFDVPAVMMSLIDETNQYVKSSVGIPTEVLGEQRTLPRQYSLCAHVVGNNQAMVVEDLAADERFRDNPLLVQTGVRFYAGAPMRTDSGQPVGTLCVVDNKPRKITEREQRLLSLVADGLMTEMKLRAASRHLLDHTRAMQRDLSAARIVQRFLLPPMRQQTEQFAVWYDYHPVEAIGGDFLDARLRSDGLLAMFIADVSGHGAQAALTSAMLKSAFSRAAVEADGSAALLSDVHRDLGAVAQTTQFITALATVFDPAGQTLLLTSAGHPYPILLRAGKATTVSIVNDLPLLIEPGLDYQRQTTLSVRSKDRVIFYTDGATEAVDGAGTMLETAGFLKFIESKSHLTGEEFVPALVHKVRSYADGRLRDDVAIVCLEVK